MEKNLVDIHKAIKTDLRPLLEHLAPISECVSLARLGNAANKPRRIFEVLRSREIRRMPDSSPTRQTVFATTVTSREV